VLGSVLSITNFDHWHVEESGAILPTFGSKIWTDDAGLAGHVLLIDLRKCAADVLGKSFLLHSSGDNCSCLLNLLDHMYGLEVCVMVHMRFGQWDTALRM